MSFAVAATFMVRCLEHPVGALAGLVRDGGDVPGPGGAARWAQDGLVARHEQQVAGAAHGHAGGVLTLGARL
jgi:hypothetical protein